MIRTQMWHQKLFASGCGESRGGLTSQLGLTKTTIPELGGLQNYAASLPIKRPAVARWKASHEEVLVLM